MAKFKRELLCGCIVAVDYDGNARVVYCPKHAAAPEMYQSLIEARQEIEYLHNKFQRTGTGERSLAQVNQALAKAEGRL